MHAQIAHTQAQRLLRQRNWLTGIAALLTVTTIIGIAGAASRDQEIILVPISTQPLNISSAGASAEYMELVTRDTALMLLNRSPEGLDYWMEQILGLADPSAHGELKADLLKIVAEQRGSDVAQAFVIRSLTVNPKGLTSSVTGTLKTFVGSQVIASEERSFAFQWRYRGLRLSLSGFNQISDDVNQKDQSQ